MNCDLFCLQNVYINLFRCDFILPCPPTPPTEKFRVSAKGDGNILIVNANLIFGKCFYHLIKMTKQTKKKTSIDERALVYPIAFFGNFVNETTVRFTLVIKMR